MTKIPLHFLALFADLHAGDELILHKGPGLMNWKIEVLQKMPRQGRVPLPREYWQSIFSSLPSDWQGNIRFFYCPNGAPWRTVVKTCPPVDVDRGIVDIS